MIRWILFVSLCWPLATHAAVYKWVDAEGNVHFTDRKPEDEKSVELIDTSDTELRASQRQEVAQRKQLLKDSESKTRAAETPAAETEEQRAARRKIDKQNQEIRAKNCIASRENLENSIGYNRLYTTDPQGNREFLDDDEQTARAESYRKDVAKYCD